MFVVTGGAGFIGSHLVKALNEAGESEIIVVDDLTDGTKFRNLAGCAIADYIDHAAFREAIRSGRGPDRVKAVLHQGACSDTTEWDGRYMMDANFETSKEVFAWCQSQAIPMVYASSAAVYGPSTTFAELAGNEQPINVYGWSKWVFDQWFLRHMKRLNAPVAGFRYFNVYGPNEGHKGRMASVVHHFDRQLRETGKVRLFEGSHGYDDGEHRRDFVHISDVVKVNLWAIENPSVTGIFNLGTGASHSFNDMARAVIAWHGRGEIEYIPMPDDLVKSYQAFTEADLTRLREAGYRAAFVAPEEGVRLTLDALKQRAA
ncbi:MAG: ADP-glyceromanno-heptose 6-epimerase [Bauldia sp.]|nr:ADP-glyceromanno-heptose 6-epimerase [Bauldia sp.]